ncbi:MAG: hypothetical protein KME02_00810 [Aphanothece saxicola GSE-SYN-MK-01-06B]|nr:hypothetical protein [Aphanothece saxicola GSE-SYN-MK-01-06B]
MSPLIPLFVVHTTNSFEQASTNLQTAIDDVCSPGQAARVLINAITLNTALPCRIRHDSHH